MNAQKAEFVPVAALKHDEAINNMEKAANSNNECNAQKQKHFLTLICRQQLKKQDIRRIRVYIKNYNG